MELKGMDVSSYQENINWDKVSKTDIKFAILRCHQRYGIDECFLKNVKGCITHNIPFGVYKYSYALNEVSAGKEADSVIDTLKLAGLKDLELPVFYDLEDSSQRTLLTKQGIENIAITFLKKIEEAGFRTGIYCNGDWYKNVLTEKLKKYPLWIASYPAQDDGTVKERLKPDTCDIWQYSSKGKVDGINGGVDLNIMYNDLRSEVKEEITEVNSYPTAEELLTLARSWIGKNQSDGSHKAIIDLYNSHTPLARGYKVTYTDSWCDTFISALFIFYDAVDLIGGTECGVEEHIKKFKAIDIWEEDGTITPKPGDIICYNWDSYVQPNDGYADHIGIVEAVDADNRKIIVIEGNYSSLHTVARRSIDIGNGNIRGFARPKYLNYSKANSDPSSMKTTKSIEEISREVISGKWGNGAARKNALESAGYDYATVQAKVNDLIIEDRAKEVIAGKWGNGVARKNALEAAGFNYELVQKKVNELLK
mgnify:CR=1 FL=1